MDNRNKENKKAALLAKNIIRDFESLQLHLYICPAGKKTIGFGHVVSRYEKIPDSIKKSVAEKLLDHDIKKAQITLNKYCKVPLTHNQQAALISFIFNVGTGSFQASTLRQKLNRCEYILAANELLKWTYSNGIKLKGLEKRRKLERSVFLNNTEQEKKKQ